MSDKPELFFNGKNAFDVMNAKEIDEAFTYADDYKRFLDGAKTEREAVAFSASLAEKCGFKRFDETVPLSPGDKLYRIIRGKALMLAHIGSAPLEDGVNIAAAHVDSPRLDLRQLPLYEDAELAQFKTHYYGGIKKYQWVTIPLSLHGVVIKLDGTAVPVKIGEDAGDPVFTITDLLPHLGREQAKKTLGEAFTGENLNILVGSRPTGGEKDSDRFRLTVLEILHEKYGIAEEDFMSAELEAVPAWNARDIGFDRSMIGAYGHDDRSCAFAALSAILDVKDPKKTVLCLLADKEEIGSDGVSGMKSAAFERFFADICYAFRVNPRDCLSKSFCVSSDVANAFDPNFPEVSEKRNSAKLGHGIALLKHTGSGGKSGSSEACAETIAALRRVFASAGVLWQMGELGKVDQGGGGTIAKYMANRDVETIDAGVPVLSMHSPFEVVSKLDCYMTYKGICAIYENM